MTFFPSNYYSTGIWVRGQEFSKTNRKVITNVRRLLRLVHRIAQTRDSGDTVAHVGGHVIRRVLGRQGVGEDGQDGQDGEEVVVAVAEASHFFVFRRKVTRKR